MLRVNNGVLVVPPFECAWLTGDGYTLRSGSGCLSFEAKGDTDVTVILKSTPGAKRLQPLLRQAPGGSGSASGGNALQVEQNYTIIFGSHRNSCLKVEKNGVTQCMVTGVACSRVSNKAFSKYWIDLNHGVLTVGHGEPGQGVCHQWRDAQEIPGIQHIGLSCWDRHVSYRSISLQAPLDFTRLQQSQLAGGGAAGKAAIPSLFDATCAAIMTATTPANVCRTLHVAELLLPTTQKLYRYCLDFIARHLETVVRLDTDGGGDADVGGGGGGGDPASATQHDQRYEDDQLRSVSPAAMCDLVCQNTFSVDERGIFAAVHDWACHHIAAAVAAAAVETGCAEARRSKGSSGGGGEAEAGGRNCVRRLVSPPGGSPRGPGSPVPPAGPRPRLSEPQCAISPAGGPGGRRSRTPSHTNLTAVLDLVGLPLTPAMSGRPPLPPAGGSAAAAATAAAASHCGAAAEEAACRVFSLIRFPLLPIEQLHACLRDPLLLRLPAVLELVHEALEVHRRETGAGQDAAAAAHPGGVAGGGGGDGSAGSSGPVAVAAGMMSPSSGRRLVKPLPATAGGGGSSAAAGGAAAAGADAGGVGAPPTGGGAAGAAAGGGGGGTPAAGDSCWSVRYQRRCLPFALELMYVCDGDSCGVLHFLGTSYGVQGWVNPMLAKRVDVRTSSPTGRTTDPRVVVGRQFVRTNFAGPRYVNGAAISWWQVDLGEQHQLAITYYTLRHDGSQDFVRSWVLQGSHDLATWVDLKRHTHDTTIKVPGQYASWPVIGPAAAVPYRAFRLLLTAPNASPNPASRHNFCLSNLELYGFLHKGPAAGSSGSAAAAAGGGSRGNATGSGGVGGSSSSSSAASGNNSSGHGGAGGETGAAGSSFDASTSGAAAAGTGPEVFAAGAAASELPA